MDTMNTLSKLVLLATLASLGACTWVKPTVNAADVKVVEPEALGQCRKVGSTTVSVLDKVAGIPRSYTKLTEELATLARNEAPNLGGDTVVPVSEIINGQRMFDVYDCRPDAQGGAVTLPYAQ